MSAGVTWVGGTGRQLKFQLEKKGVGTNSKKKSKKNQKILTLFLLEKLSTNI
jgi:hypothetical protein